MEWLESQEEDQLIRFKANAEKGMETSALTGAGVASALKLIGRIGTLPIVVNKILETHRTQEDSAKSE